MVNYHKLVKLKEEKDQDGIVGASTQGKKVNMKGWKIATLLPGTIFCSVWIFLNVQKVRHVSPWPRLQKDNSTAEKGPFTLSKLLHHINCTGDILGNLKRNRESADRFLSDQSLISRTGNCREYFRLVDGTSGLTGNGNVTAEEAAFPLAFGHSVHQQAGLLEMALALMFRPLDSHCVHIDVKTGERTRKAVEGLVRCYQEQFPDSDIFIARHPISVFWGHVSVLDADLICYRELLERNNAWKMVINPASSELPLVTIEELRSSLKSTKGNGVLDAYHNPSGLFWRHKTGFALNRYTGQEFALRFVPVPQYLKPPVPYNLQVLKGYKNVALTRNFTHFLIHHPVAIAYYNWVQDTAHPDEHFYATLSSITHIEGSSVTQNVSQVFLNTFEQGRCVRVSWWFSDSYCKGQMIRGICNFGLGDLPRLRGSKCFMANKFNIDTDALAVMCQVGHMRRKAQGLTMDMRHFDEAVKTLPVAKRTFPNSGTVRL